MKHFAIALSALILLPATSEAACFGAGEPLFHCTVDHGRKAVDVCLQGGVAIYRFGPPTGAAEMLLAPVVTETEMTPWNGIGRYLWEEVTFYNGRYAYLVSYSLDRTAPNGQAAPEGGIIVAEGDSELADLQCDAGSVTEANFYPLFEAKEAAGQPWCPATQSWGMPCN
ncbi:hypothetical protein M4578_03035 [Salipiger sp. P9]|uniref:hypothetical protein n=1 Tax=Salipiger pentaromativorans TaxID=2943193 RepID=UPI002158639E|nr:hypothetical protein [Salipiger pentaromativorans]MCR8546789.1 hypothetical protein [Salipiger pentaromativorans]